jgi:AcrR family transcriptional regulator
VVDQALTLIAQEGLEALTMRTLGARLGVVPGALYRHVRSKEQLQDLIVDGVLAEVDCDTNPELPWTEQITLLAHRLRKVLEDHPGVAGLLKTRDPLGPHSLTLAEAFLLPLHNAGIPHREAGSRSSSSPTTPSDLRSAAPASPPTNNVSRTRRPENGSTNSSDRFPMTASPP